MAKKITVEDTKGKKYFVTILQNGRKPWLFFGGKEGKAIFQDISSGDIEHAVAGKSKKITGIAKKPGEFAHVKTEWTINAKNVRRCYRTIIRELNLKAPSTNPISLIPRFVAELSLDAETEKTTIKILQSFVTKYSTSGKDPKGLCAGALYLVCKKRDKRISQKEIANVVGVTEVTLRSRYKELVNKLNIEI